MRFESITDVFNISGIMQQGNGNLKYIKTSDVKFAMVLEYVEQYDLDTIEEWLQKNDDQIRSILQSRIEGKITDDFGRIKIIPITSINNQYEILEYSGYISIFAVNLDVSDDEVYVYLMGGNRKLLDSNTVLITLNVQITVTEHTDEQIIKSGFLGLKKDKIRNSYVKVDINARKLKPGSLWYEVSTVSSKGADDVKVRIPITNEMIEKPFYIQNVKHENIDFYGASSVVISYTDGD